MDPSLSPCPYCDELIQPLATKCRFCKEQLPRKALEAPNAEDRVGPNALDVTGKSSRGRRLLAAAVGLLLSAATAWAHRPMYPDGNPFLRHVAPSYFSWLAANAGAWATVGSFLGLQVAWGLAVRRRTPAPWRNMIPAGCVIGAAVVTTFVVVAKRRDLSDFEAGTIFGSGLVTGIMLGIAAVAIHYAVAGPFPSASKLRR